MVVIFGNLNMFISQDYSLRKNVCIGCVTCAIGSKFCYTTVIEIWIAIKRGHSKI